MPVLPSQIARETAESALPGWQVITRDVPDAPHPRMNEAEKVQLRRKDVKGLPQFRNVVVHEGRVISEMP
jgi:hypothetical protein